MAQSSHMTPDHVLAYKLDGTDFGVTKAETLHFIGNLGNQAFDDAIDAKVTFGAFDADGDRVDGLTLNVLIGGKYYEVHLIATY